MRNILVLVIGLMFISSGKAEDRLTLSSYEFKAENGEAVQAELGELKVPENRNGKSDRTITLRFIRFKSTSKELRSPIIYLAGGPGGSGISAARESRFPLFLAMREFGDVIALDQRGTGMSEPDLSCKESYMFPFSEPLDRTEAGKIFALAAGQCFDRLRAQGIDLSAYNTRENAADLNDLRQALGASRMSLWGISYGTHLALATMKYYGDHVDRVILAGVEPLDHTLKLPQDQQRLIEKIDSLSKKDGKIRALLPDLIDSITKLMQKLETKPQTVSLTHPLNGQTASVTVGKFDLQLVLSDMLVGPETFSGMPDLIARLEKGDWIALALLSGQKRMGTMFNAMSIAMDCASGASAAWVEEIRRQADSTLLGDAMNFPFPEICNSQFDLGDEFRKPFDSSIPALLISGTLDGRTPSENAKKTAKHLSNSQHLVIEGAGHSDPLFLSSPKILKAIKVFMKDGNINEKTITIRPDSMIVPRTIAEVPEEVLSLYTGSYKINEKEVRRVIKAGNVLYTQRGDRPFPIRSMSTTDFFYEGLPSRLHFELDSKGKVKGMTMFQQGSGPGDFSPKIDAPPEKSSQSNTEVNIEMKVDTYLDPYLKAGFFSGAILIAKQGRILVNRGYGLASHEFQVPNSPKTKFQIASISKSFTSAAILILRDKKLLSTSDPLAKFIPDYPNGDRILIHHLLTHTSGIPNVNEFPEYDEKSKFPQTLANIIAWFKNKPLEFEPGAKYSYSNSNYNLLAYVIENVSGKSYGEFLKEEIFQPLQMENTGHNESSAKIIRSKASGYVPVWLNEFTAAPFLEWSIKTGNGSLYSTAEDLYKWDRALYGNKILSSSTVKEIYEKKYGWFVGDRFGRKRVYSNGRSPGFNSYLERYIANDVCIVLLSNQYTALAHSVIGDMAAIVFGEKYEQPQPFEPVSSADLEEYAGKYEFGPDFYRPGPVELKTRDGKLIAAWDGFESGLVPVSQGKFILLAFWANISFVRDTQGKIIAMVYHEGDTQFRAKPL